MLKHFWAVGRGVHVWRSEDNLSESGLSSGYVGPKDRTHVVILVGSTFICELACQPPLLSKREYLGDGIHVASQKARQTRNRISDIRVLGLNSLTPYS